MSTPTPTTVAAASATPTPTKAADVPLGRHGDIYSIGNTVNVDNVYITLESVRLSSDGSSGYVPSSGNFFMEWFFVVENNSVEEVTIYNSNFDCYIDGWLTDHSYRAAYGFDDQSLSNGGKVKPGKKVEVRLYYEVPATLKEGEIVFSVAYDSRYEATFKIHTE